MDFDGIFSLLSLFVRRFGKSFARKLFARENRKIEAHIRLNTAQKDENLREASVLIEKLKVYEKSEACLGI